MTTQKRDTVYKHKSDHGALFVNQHKSSSAAPDYTGNYTTQDGEQRRIAAWVNKTKSGTEYLSITFSDEYRAKAS